MYDATSSSVMKTNIVNIKDWLSDLKVFHYIVYINVIERISSDFWGLVYIKIYKAAFCKSLVFYCHDWFALIYTLNPFQWNFKAHKIDVRLFSFIIDRCQWIDWNFIPFDTQNSYLNSNGRRIRTLFIMWYSKIYS